MSSLLVGLDIGGTKIATLITDTEGHTLATSVVPTNSTSAETFLESIDQGIRLAREALSEQGEILAIGAGIPGQVELHTGVVRQAVNLGLTSYPLGSYLSQRYACPAYIENDVRTAALATYQYFHQRAKISHLAYLSIGTGVSAGIVIDGHLYRGANGMAGEIGHVIVAPDGHLCRCGLRGCLETVVSGPAIARQGRQLMGDPTINTQWVYQAAALGDEIAMRVVKRVSHYLALAVHVLIMVYDVEMVVLGGGVIKAGNAFLNPILAEWMTLRESSPLAALLLTAEKITLLPPDYNAGTWGALYLAKQGLPLSA